ncbi:MAG: replicative DNA helicase [Cytophagales bacterium]
MNEPKRGSARQIKLSQTQENEFHTTGKVQPQASDLEMAVLGALMLEKDALTNVIEILRPESFYVEKNKIIYEAILKLFGNSEPVDILTVTNQLKKTGQLIQAGGPFYLTELTNRVNSAANIEYHARVILEQAIKRELISISSGIQTKAFEDTQDALELLDEAGASIFEISDRNVRKDYQGMTELMRMAIDELENKKNQKDGLTGVPSGFTKLDRVTSGWQKSDMVIIAARPAMGKTAFVMSALRNAAVDHDTPVAIFSLEMSSLQLVNRLISAEAELESDKIKTGQLQEYEWTQLYEKTKRISNAPIFIDDTPGLSILELRAKCRKLKQQHDIQLIIIDYLQLMSGDLSKKGGNREQEIASISRSLKNIAKELNVPVIALSQLSRAVETRGGDKRPMLSDLRESGSIEQDADMVLFLYRPEYYGITQDTDGGPTEGMGEIIIAKHRNGSLADVKLRFVGKYTKFMDFEDFSGAGFSSGNYGSFSGNSFTVPSKANDITDDSDNSEDGDKEPF